MPLQLSWHEPSQNNVGTTTEPKPRRFSTFSNSAPIVGSASYFRDFVYQYSLHFFSEQQTHPQHQRACKVLAPDNVL